LTYFRKIFKSQISRKSVYCEPSCFVRMDGRPNGHGDANSHFSQLCERA